MSGDAGFSACDSSGQMEVPDHFQSIVFKSNNRFMVTDHDLRLLAESWEKLQESEPGIKTAFAQGYKAALQEINKIKKTL